MAPVQRTAKLWAVVSAEWLGTGFAKAQSKSISLSMRVISGAPSKPGPEKYSPFSPSTFESAAARSMVRGTGTCAAHDIGRALGVEHVFAPNSGAMPSMGRMGWSGMAL